ncbi:hypothetical protein [Salidesulfovibrio onnuriiensis]|uniref:hypothetical protein n=1 Tax=Salidesulfovibrio onnuriiensis TaxID=2583823 RepID=UPI0011C78739|nr:hypothetical protein [Salidesulfovibrio onnuriiensis]
MVDCSHCDGCGIREKYEYPDTVYVDPVCGKKLDPRHHDVRCLKVDGREYWFCGTKCMTRFIEQHKGDNTCS